MLKCLFSQEQGYYLVNRKHPQATQAAFIGHPGFAEQAWNDRIVLRSLQDAELVWISVWDGTFP